jgi:hypothetical protein
VTVTVCAPVAPTAVNESEFGATVTCPGETLGVLVGFAVGVPVGLAVGVLEAVAVGVLVGLAVALAVAVAVGIADGAGAGGDEDPPPPHATTVSSAAEATGGSSLDKKAREAERRADEISAWSSDIRNYNVPLRAPCAWVFCSPPAGPLPRDGLFGLKADGRAEALDELLGR